MLKAMPGAQLNRASLIFGQMNKLGLMYEARRSSVVHVSNPR